MIDELLQDRSALYVSGAMNAREREDFELILEFHHELREYVAGLQAVGAALTLASLRGNGRSPSPGLKSRVLGAIADRRQETTADGCVMTTPEGLVQWVNSEFSEMCGYSLDELRGKKLGPILQGKKTDRETAARMRRAVHERRPCLETILNYHRDGTPYWVEIAITPIFDDAGQPLWFVAREHEVPEPIAA